MASMLNSTYPLSSVSQAEIAGKSSDFLPVATGETTAAGFWEQGPGMLESAPWPCSFIACSQNNEVSGGLGAAPPGGAGSAARCTSLDTLVTFRQTRRAFLQPKLAYTSASWSDRKTSRDAGPGGQTCGRWVTLVCVDCVQEQLTQFYVGCGDRFACPFCRHDWQNKLQRRFQPVLDAMKRQRVRLLTLTWPNGSDLADTKRRGMKGWQKLLRRGLWKNNVQGGVRAIETTNRGKGWHPHFHIAYVGKYIPQDELQAVWSECMGEPCIVDIRKTDPRWMKELFKYTVKDYELTADQLAEVRRVFKGVQAVVAFGCFRGKLRPKAAEKAHCVFCGSTHLVPRDMLTRYLERRRRQLNC